MPSAAHDAFMDSKAPCSARSIAGGVTIGERGGGFNVEDADSGAEEAEVVEESSATDGEAVGDDDDAAEEGVRGTAEGDVDDEDCNGESDEETTAAGSSSPVCDPSFAVLLPAVAVALVELSADGAVSVSAESGTEAVTAAPTDAVVAAELEATEAAWLLKSSAESKENAAGGRSCKRNEVNVVGSIINEQVVGTCILSSVSWL